MRSSQRLCKKLLIKKLLTNLVIIGSFLIVAYLSMALMLKYHFIPGASDQLLHINRIAEVRTSLTHLSVSQFGYNYLHGSAIMTLYPYINLLPIVFLSFLIKSKVLLFFTSFSLYIFITLLICYYSSLSLNKSKSVSYLFAVIYSVSLMYISYTFITSDLSESAVMAWMPLIIFGFLRLIKYHTKWLELSIGMSLIIGTHVISAIIAIMLVVAWAAINIKQLKKSTLFSMIKAAIMTAGATMVIWTPAILFMLTNKSFIRPNSTKISNFAIPLSFLVKDSLIGRGIEGIDIFAIIEILLGTMFFFKFNRYQKQMFGISIFIMLFCSKLFPWQIMPHFFVKFFDQFQFTTRFYTVPQVILNYLFAILIMKIAHTRKAKIEIITVISLFALGLQVREQYQLMSFEKTVPSFNRKLVNDSQSKKNTFNNFCYDSSPKNHKNGVRLNLQSLYKISNNQNYKLTENVTNDPVTFDYWPSNSCKNIMPQVLGNHFSVDRGIATKRTVKNKHKFNPIQDIAYRHQIYWTSPSFKVHPTGFDKIKFYNPSSRRTNLMLPFFHYHGEHLKLYDNNKPIKIDKNANTIDIKNAPRKENHIRLVPKSSYKLNIGKYISLASWVIYILIIFISFINMLIKTVFSTLSSVLSKYYSERKSVK